MEKPKILIVEDNLLDRKLLESGLHKMGCRIVGQTAVGEEVLDLTKKTKPDLILIDIELEGEMDGISVTENLEFAKQLKTTATNFKFELLIQYCDKLLENIRNFDIGKMEKELNSFPELVTEIKKIFKN